MKSNMNLIQFLTIIFQLYYIKKIFLIFKEKIDKCKSLANVRFELRYKIRVLIYILRS